jgi:hypothetical protein
MRTLFVLTALFGLWLLASPFVLNFLGVARGNAITVGLVVTVIGIMGAAGVTRTPSS